MTTSAPGSSCSPLPLARRQNDSRVAATSIGDQAEAEMTAERTGDGRFKTGWPGGPGRKSVPTSKLADYICEQLMEGRRARRPPSDNLLCCRAFDTPPGAPSDHI